MWTLFTLVQYTVKRNFFCFWILHLSTFYTHYFAPAKYQSSRLQIQRSGFDSRRYQIFWEVVGLKRGPLGVVSTTKGVLERKSSDSSLEIREYGHRDTSRWPRGTLYLKKLALTSSTSGGRLVGIVRSWTQATEFSLIFSFKSFCVY
jgi:hypothetical protein